MKRQAVHIVPGIIAAALLCALPEDTSAQPVEPALSIEAPLAKRLAKIESSFSGSPSPDGKTVAFISNLSGLPQIWTVPVSGGWPRRITDFDDPVTAVRWSPKGNRLAFSLAPGGGLNEQMYVTGPDGRDTKRITGGGKASGRLGVWAPDGARLSFTTAHDDAANLNAFVFDPDSDTLTMVSDDPGIEAIYDFSRDGNWALKWRLISRGHEELSLLNLKTGLVTVLVASDSSVHVSAAAFAPGQQLIYMATNLGRDRIALGQMSFEMDGTTGSLDIIAKRDDAELLLFDMAPDGSEAALVWNAGGRSELAFLNLKSQRLRDGPKLPAEIVSSLSFSSDGHHLLLDMEGAASPPNVWTLDVKSETFTSITQSSTPGLRLDQLIRPELVSFKAHDGLQLTGWLYKPENFSEPGSVVLSFHGGPEVQERPHFKPVYQSILAGGIAIFAPNVRGSDGFGKTFKDLDNQNLRFDAVNDIESCLDYIIEVGIADPQRIGIMGGSYGGYMVAAGITEFPDRFAAAANLYGIVNLETFFETTEPWMAAISTAEFGDPTADKDLLRTLSPIHKADRIATPTLVLHGQNDTNVPVGEAHQLVDKLEMRGIPVRFVLFADEGHGFQKINNRIQTAEEIVGWFETYLKP